MILFTECSSLKLLCVYFQLQLTDTTDTYIMKQICFFKNNENYLILQTKMQNACFSVVAASSISSQSDSLYKCGKLWSCVRILYAKFHCHRLIIVEEIEWRETWVTILRQSNIIIQTWCCRAMLRIVDDSPLATLLRPSMPWKTLHDPLDPTRCHKNNVHPTNCQWTVSNINDLTLETTLYWQDSVISA